MNEIPEAEWKAWIEVQKAAVRAGLMGDEPSAALALLDQFLETDPAGDIQREAIAFRGTFHQEQGDFASAKADFISALELAEEGYVRFELQETLAEVSKKLGDTDGTDHWYATALRTGAADPRVPGGGFLLRFLNFRGRQGLSDEERQLAQQMVSHGWHLLQVDGEPDLENLEGTARRLIEAQQKLHRSP